MKESYILWKFLCMNKYKIIVQYDGFSFSGFQSQKNLNTIKAKIIDKIFLGTQTRLKLSINDKESLLRLKPESYVGEASKIVEQL